MLVWAGGAWCRWMSAKNPVHFQYLLKIPVYLCDQNTETDRLQSHAWNASQESPSSAAPQANLYWPGLIQDTAALCTSENG